MGCDRNVQYRNPHLLLGYDEVASWTSDLDTAFGDRDKIDFAEAFLDGLQTDEILPEYETPLGLKTTLYR